MPVDIHSIAHHAGCGGNSMDKKLLNDICKKIGKETTEVASAIGSNIDNYIIFFNDMSMFVSGKIIKGGVMDKKQLKQHKSTFHFGASVRYEKILSRILESAEGNTFKTIKFWNQKQVPTRTGIVVGWRWLSNGIGNYDSESGNCYTATESLFAIEVKRGMMNKVDLVLPESLTITNYYDIRYLPDRVPTMSDKGKQWLSNEMKSVPRDSKGRWIY